MCRRFTTPVLNRHACLKLGALKGFRFRILVLLRVSKQVAEQDGFIGHTDLAKAGADGRTGTLQTPASGCDIRSSGMDLQLSSRRTPRPRPC